MKLIRFEVDLYMIMNQGKLKIRVGTSGYSYYWNEGKPTPFEWYLKQGFQTVEINASFYRFPLQSWAEEWSKAPDLFDLSIKVHRSITHYTKFRGKAIDLWKRFKAPLSKIEDKISFWLFQMPSVYSYSYENLEALSKFFDKLDLGNKAVVEFRNGVWWRHIDEIKKIGIGFCSVDAPRLPRDIVAINDLVYVRLHGRKAWYSYIYTKRELRDIMSKICRARAARKYVYLNNDEGMLENSKFLMNLSKEICD